MRNIAIIRINEFEEMLRAHKFAFTASDPQELREILEEENKLQQVAINGDSRFVNLFADYQHRALETVGGYSHHSDPDDGSQITIQSTEDGYADTGINFLEFRSLVRNFDWEYNTIQDRDRYNNGKKELEVIRQIAIERGGEFIRFWQEECQKRKLWAFTRAQNSAIQSRRY